MIWDHAVLLKHSAELKAHLEVKAVQALHFSNLHWNTQLSQDGDRLYYAQSGAQPLHRDRKEITSRRQWWRGRSQCAFSFW